MELRKCIDFNIKTVHTKSKISKITTDGSKGYEKRNVRGIATHDINGQFKV
jgi:hypothetical protein